MDHEPRSFMAFSNCAQRECTARFRPAMETFAGVLVFAQPSATEIARGGNERKDDAPLVCRASLTPGEDGVASPRMWAAGGVARRDRAKRKSGEFARSGGSF
jgi:hypothetical protein